MKEFNVDTFKRMDDLGEIVYNILYLHSEKHKKIELKYFALRYWHIDDYNKLDSQQTHEICELNHTLPVFKELFLIFENGIDMENEISNMNIENKKMKLKEAYDIVYNELLKYGSEGIKELDELYKLTIDNLQ